MISIRLQQALPVSRAMVAVDEARQHLLDYANATDCPQFEVVQALDWLDVVAALLERAAKALSIDRNGDAPERTP